MPRLDYKRCKSCGRTSDECGPLSHSRLCADCGLALQTLAIIEIAGHYGDAFQKWRRGMAGCVGAGWLDDVTTNP